MTAILYQTPAAAGTDLVFAAAAGGGDTLQPNDRGILLVKNADATPKTVTIVTPGNDKYGIARPDITKSVAAGATTAFGPFGSDLADPADGLIDITYSAVTSVTVAAVRV